MIRIAGGRVSTVNVQLRRVGERAARARDGDRVLAVCEPSRPEDDSPVPRRDARSDRPAVQHPRRLGDVARVSRDRERERRQSVPADERGSRAVRIEPAAAVERDERRHPDKRGPAGDRVQRPPPPRRSRVPAPLHGGRRCRRRGAAQPGRQREPRPAAAVLDGCARLAAAATPRRDGPRVLDAPARSRSASSVSGPMARAKVSRAPLAPF